LMSPARSPFHLTLGCMMNMEKGMNKCGSNQT
jgi:hypothetical protein